MSLSRHHRIRRATMAAASLIVLCGCGTALADPASSPGLDAPVALKALPASPNDLVLRGETARRSVSVVLSGTEPDAIRQLQVGFTNSVVLLPEASSLKVSINGQPLAAVPLRAGTAAALVPLDIPAGILKAGVNVIDIEATMRHRVDCSLAATYELWTRLDPASTGFVLGSAKPTPVASVADLAQLPLASDGTTRIRLRLPSLPDAVTLTRAATLIDAVVRQAHLVHPIVDIGSDSGQGAGFDVALDDTLVSAPIEGRDGGVGFVRDATTGRVGVVLMGRDEAERDAALNEIAARPVPAALAHEREITLDGPTRLKLADVGVRDGDFAGRHGEAAFGLALPTDFFPGDYDKARLLVDGSYAAGLDGSSALAMRVNGILASAVPLSSGRGGEFRWQAMDVPLRFFHPGRNEVVLESVATRAEDRRCDALPWEADARLKLSPASEFVFPAFAHLGTAPQLAGALASRGAGARPVPVYIGMGDRESASATLTVLANKAAAGDLIAQPAIRLALPDPTDAPGLVVAAWNALPSRLALPFVGAVTAKDAGWPAPAENSAAGRPQGIVDSIRKLGEKPAVARALQNIRAFGHDVASLAPGRAFDAPAEATRLPVSSHTLLFAAVEADLGRPSALPIPTFSMDSRQWLLVTAPSTALIESGAARFVAEGRWPSLQGRAVTFDPDKKVVASLAPAQVTYLLPDHVTLSDIRPVLGGLVSDNVEAAVAAIMLLIAVLGLSTHGLVRRPGAK